MLYKRTILLALSVLVFSILPASAQQVSVKRFGSLQVTQQGQNWLVALPQLGSFSFQGTIAPLNLESKVQTEALARFPGYSVLRRIGLEDVTLKLNAEGLSIVSRIDTRKNLKPIVRLFNIQAPFVEVTARVAPGGLSLRGDLMFARRNLNLLLIPKLGTRLLVERLSLALDVGVELAGDDEPKISEEAKKKKKLINLDVTPVVSVQAAVKVQPTQWDKPLSTLTEFSYNLVSQELTLAGTMTDRWVNPLGLSRVFKNREGVVFENAAFEIGWIPGSPTPTKLGFGIETAKVLDLVFGALVDFSPTEGQLAFQAKINKLSFNDLANIVTRAFGKRMPNIIPGDLALHNVEVLFSPNGGKVGELEISQGFALKGEARLSKALNGKIDFTANFDDGLILSVEMNNSMRQLLLEKVRGHKALKVLVNRITSTLNLRRIAIDLKAMRSEFGGGVACDLTVFGKRLNFTLSGSFNPDKLVDSIIDKIVDLAGDEFKAAYRAVGNAAKAAGNKGKQVAMRAAREAGQMAHDVKTSVKHSGHSKNKCMKECVPRYANGQRRKMLDGTNEAVREFYLEARKEIRGIEGETVAQTRRLREMMLRDEWNDLLRDIDAKWKKVYDDDEVENYFVRGSSEKEARKKYRGLIDESWNAHKNYRNTLWNQLINAR